MQKAPEALNQKIARYIALQHQYQTRYQENLILFVLQDLLKPEAQHFLQEELKRKHIRAAFR